ncbi:MAG: tetratricopeptide repeat protein [Planctomycetota bacterium]|nr:tetratricopeptide repeat protein [Planctomycetota bacterium]MDI6788147.1 tetratricopeptide repeat protein [Planctomycetota bacterium]
MNKIVESLPDPYKPCPCGSGKKYKFCCLHKDRSTSRNIRGTHQKPFILAEETPELDGPIMLLPGPDGKPVPESLVIKADIINRLESLPTDTHQEAMDYFQKGLKALEGSDFDRSIEYCNRAIALIDFYPPAYNNRSMALFFKWRREEAIRDALTVKEKLDPTNVSATVNLIRFYLMNNDCERVQFYHSELDRLDLISPDERLKAIEGYALLEADEKVRELCQGMLDKKPEPTVWYFHAIALANLGLFGPALDSLKHYQTCHSHGSFCTNLSRMIEQQQGNKKYRQRFPYFDLPSIFPQPFTEILYNEFGSVKNDEIFTRKLKQFAEREPSLGTWGRYLMWYDQKGCPFGIQALESINTPWAIDELKKFALGDYRETDLRMEALFALHRLDIIKMNELVRFWQDSAWHEIKVFGQEITEEVAGEYDPAFLEEDRKARTLLGSGKLAQALKRYQEIIKHWPKVARGYTNLAGIYMHLGLLGEARSYLEKATALEPHYPFAICALSRLNIMEGKLDDAHETLSKMTEIERMHPDALGYWWYTTAMLAIARGDREGAQQQLKHLQNWDPHHNYTQALKEELSR